MAATSYGGRGIPAMSPSQPILNLGRWALLVYRWRLARELIANASGEAVCKRTLSKDWRKEQ
jgi:hypothetical protein